MTAAVLPYQSTSLMSMSLYGNNERTEGYYQPTTLPHPTQQNGVPHSYVEQRQLPNYRTHNTAPRDDAPFLHPRNSLPPLQPASNYSSPTVIVPPASHQRYHYGPIDIPALQTSPNSMVYVEHGPGSAYTNTQYPGATYSLAGSPDHVSSNQMMRAPSYQQASPTSTLPSPYSAGGRPFYGYTSYNHTLQQQQQQQQQQNYVHSAGSAQYIDGRASISIPQPTSATTAYTRYSQPTTPQSAREQSSMYAQGYNTTAHVATPRRAPLPSYHSMSSSASKASPPSGNSHSKGAAPGPIPATTPVVVKDVSGVQWIKFMYSKDKHKREYNVRCDTETVDIPSLSPTFKAANLVYPRAARSSEYRGTRWRYESECNHIAWALTHLNPDLRENRGATQRAVDSWRNTCEDVKMRSRRVKRQTKAVTRAKAQQQMQASQQGVSGHRQSSALAAQRPLPETPSGSTHEHRLPASSVDKTVAQTSTPLHTLPPPNTILTSPLESRYNAQGYHPQRNEYEAYHLGQGYGQHTHGNTTYSMMPPPPQAGASLYSREEMGYAGRHQ